MKNMIIVIVLFVVIVIIVPIVAKKFISDKLATYIMTHDFEKFDKLVNSFITKMAIQPFNIDYLKMNKALATNDRKEIDGAFKTFDDKRLNDKQKEAVFSNAYYYYISIEDKTHSNKYLKELLKLETLPNEVKDDLKLAYELNIERSSDKLEETLAKYEKAQSPQERVRLEALIAKMYDNKGNKAKAKEFEELVARHIEELAK